MSFFDPFAHLVETKNSYHLGRFIRSSFWQRMKDTFRVFYGDFLDQQMGLLDYVFPFAKMSTYITLSLGTGDDMGVIRRAAFFISLVPSFLLNALKAVMAGILTLIALPGIVLAHVIFLPNAYKLDKKIQNIIVNPVVVEKSKQATNGPVNKNQMQGLMNNPNEAVAKVNRAPTLGNFLKARKGPVLIVPIVEVGPGSTLEKPEKNVSELAIYAAQHSFFASSPHAIGDKIATIKLATANADGVKALLATNSYGLTKAAEEVSDLSKGVNLVNKILFGRTQG